MTERVTRLCLTGTAELVFVEQVLDALEGLYGRAGDISDEDRMLFSLAASEILANIAVHSKCPGQSKVTVTANLSIDEKTLTARFQDDAAPSIVPLLEAQLPDELAESGRGLAIAKMALDQLSHEVNDGHTWTLVRRRRE